MGRGDADDFGADDRGEGERCSVHQKPVEQLAGRTPFIGEDQSCDAKSTDRVVAFADTRAC